MGTSLCKPIYNLTFSGQSQIALKRIKTQISLYNLGAALLMSGTIHTILTKSSPTQIAYNVTTADWGSLSKAAGDWPTAVKNIIAKEAATMQINTSGAESEFWGGLSACLRR